MSFLLATLSGVLSALSFPKFNLFFLAWLSLIPLLLLISKHSPKESFFLGAVAGSVFYGILIYWIPSVPAHYGNLSLGLSLLIYLIFFLFLGLFWGIFSLLLSVIRGAFPKIFLILAPFLWVSLEYILSHIFTGFPWGLLGNTQSQNLPFLQLASLTGVYGISFMLVLLQSMFVASLLQKRRKPFFISLILVILIHAWGVLTLRNSMATDKSLRVAVLQGNVSSDIYWDRIPIEEIEELFLEHLEMSFKAHRQGAGLIIWPEFSVPLCFSCPDALYQDFKNELFQFVAETKSTLLLGTNETSTLSNSRLFFNTALCLSPDLSLTEYHKMHLVPFGEYTPYEKFFSFIKKITHAIGDISPGKSYTLHSYKNVKFGSPICYEIIFPDLVRRFVKKGAQFLVTITNDGWYGKSSAPYQHFSIAVIRAVENRRYLLRAATTGISGIVDPYGRIISKSELMTKTFLVGDIHPLHSLTFYTRFGNYLPQGCLTMTLIFLILALIKRKHGRKSSERKII